MRATRLCLVAMGLLGIGSPPRAEAGLITFGGDYAAALGASMSTPALIGLGQAVSIPFNSGPVSGIGSVAGTVELRNVGGGSIAFTDLVLESARANGQTLFTIGVVQDFANAGPTTIDARMAIGGSYTFTSAPALGNVQIGSFGLAGSLRGTPSNPFVSFPTLSGSATSVPGQPLPQVAPLVAPLRSLSGIPASGTVTGILSLSLILTTTGSASGAGSRITIANASNSFAAVAVPEPPSLSLVGSAGLSLAVYGLRRWRRGQATGDA
jgi:hypothetical protein